MPAPHRRWWAVGRLARRVLLLALLVVLLAGGSAPAHGATEGLLWLSFQPRVLDLTAPGPLALTVKTTGRPTSVVIQPQSGPAITLERADTTTFHATLSQAQLTSAYQSGDRHSFIGFIDFYSGATRLSRGNLFVNVRTPAMPKVTIRALNENAQLSRHVLNVREDDLSAGNSARGVIKRLYGFLGDDFDFIAVVYAASFFDNRFYEGVRNDTRGIGAQLLDSGGAFGSRARLQGVVHYPPENLFDLAEPASVHEIGHRWANYLTLPVLREGRPHWPFSDLAYGIIGYSGVGGQGLEFPYRLRRQADGTYLVEAAGGRSTVFNDLELYVMGLVPASAVGEHVVFLDKSQLATIRNGAILRGPLQIVRIGDIVAADGPRVPATAAAQKSFRLATLVLSSGRLLTPSEMAFFDHMAARGQAKTELAYDGGFVRSTTKPFYLATGKRATLATTLAPTLTRQGKGGTLRTRRLGGLALVSASVFVDGEATVTAAALTPQGKQVGLAAGSRLGGTVARRGTVLISLRVPKAVLKTGALYRLVVTATGPGGASKLTIPFRTG